MAKKKKEEEPVFEFPKFDRAEYIRNDFRDSKIAFIAIPFGMLIAIITHYMISSGLSNRMAMMVGFSAPIVLIRIIPFIVKMEEFPIKKMFGPAMTCFFTWLGIFILLSNPPFQDIASPVITEFGLYDYDVGESTWKELDKDENDEYNIPANSPFTITILVLDNDEVDNVNFTIYGDNGNLMPLELEDGFPDGHENRWHYTHGGLSAGEYTIQILATDVEGNSEQITREFIVS